MPRPANYLKHEVTMDNKHTAVIVVDMLNDFITGELKCDNGVRMAPRLVKLLDAARKADIKIVFCNDAHLKDIDNELKLWGEHAMAGTHGAQVIPELDVSENDYTVTKRRYSGFFGTDLDVLLRELGIKTVVLTGLQTHLCVQHTAADAYFYGYDVVVANDATAAFTENDHNGAIDFMKKAYAARIATVDKLIKEFNS